VPRTVRVILGTHNHLPLGTAEPDAEAFYQQSCKPLLAVLYRWPAAPVVLHYSGILMEWLEEAHPEFLTLLGEMVQRGQVEILGGGYYDPILPLIPTNDKLGQLEKMTTWLRVRFETRPRGCWIAEKVWEPGLASVLRASGIDYTFVEDVQFRMAGLSGEALHRPAITEDQGKIMTLLPVCGKLAAFAGVRPPSEAVEFLRALSGPDRPGNGAPVAVLMEDGASAQLMNGGWLEGFLALARENAEWLELVTPGQYLRDHPPDARIFLPSSASAQVMRWALEPSQRSAFDAAQAAADAGGEARRFLVGGQFRHFLARYPEAWLMYAKMMNTHVLVNQVRGDKYKKKAAQNELWKGQSHHAYWYGGTGGIYANPLRKAVYQSLIEAEKITRATEIFAPSIISVDFDMDNCIEYLYQGSELNAYIHTRGGALFELDFLPASWNYLDTMVDREGPPSAAFDGPSPYPRKAFIDHFLPGAATLEDFAAPGSCEVGDFAAGTYDLVELNRALPEVLLRRQGNVAGVGPACIEKRFVFRPRSIDVYYRVTNTGQKTFRAPFGVEMNFSLAARSPECGRLFLLEEDRKREFDSDAADIAGVQGLLLRDVRNEVSVTLSSARDFRCWSLPMDAGAGEPRSFQSHCFVTSWELTLEPGEAWENHMSVGFEKGQ
jgi:4-alpha-glucanotransferase